MGTIQKAILFAAGLIITMAFIAYGLNIFSFAGESTKQTTNDWSTMQTELSESTFMVYDNATITGNQVLNALRKFSDREEFGMQVVTGKNQSTGTAGIWYYNTVSSTGQITGTGVTTLTQATDESNNNYINPSGKFSSRLVRDANNVIRAIIFEQK